jgi:hypothetical protein
MPRALEVMLSGAQADFAAGELESALSAQGAPLSLVRRQATARDLAGHKGVDPLTVTALVLSVQAALLAVWDIADRIRKRPTAQSLIEQAERLRIERGVESWVVTHGQPTAVLDVRHEETRQHGGITATDQLVEPEQPRNEPREERNARDATPHGNRDGHGIKVIDSATGIATGLSSGVALILDTIAKPAEGIIEGIANMFGASPAPPQPARTTRERLQRRAAVNKAMRNISQSVQRGDDLNAADLRVLPPVELERIRDGGDEYLMRLVQRFEREREERGRERER